MCETLEVLVDFRRGRESGSGYKPAGVALLHVRDTTIAPVVLSPFWACEAAVGFAGLRRRGGTQAAFCPFRALEPAAL